MAGFEVLRDAVLSGNRQPLENFRLAAGALVRDRAADWGDLIRERPLEQATQSLALAKAVARGTLTHLDDARLHRAVPAAGERGFGMCGLLRTYDVTDKENAR